MLLPLLPLLLLLLLLPMSVPVTGSCGVVCCCYHYALCVPCPRGPFCQVLAHVGGVGFEMGVYRE